MKLRHKKMARSAWRSVFQRMNLSCGGQYVAFSIFTWRQQFRSVR